MILTYFVPSWFLGYDILLEALFAVITFAVSLLAYKIYRESSERSVGLLSLAFLFISLSYIFESVFNGFILAKAQEALHLAVKVQHILLLQGVGSFFQMIFMMFGLAILVYMTFRSSDRRLLWFLLLVSISPLLLIPNPAQTFFLLSTIYLAFIIWNFVNNYRRRPHRKTLLVTIAFLFLFIGKAHFLFSVNHQLFYVLGHFLELIAYTFILTHLLLVLKK